mgnify:CR=1 FL=1
MGGAAAGVVLGRAGVGGGVYVGVGIGVGSGDLPAKKDLISCHHQGAVAPARRAIITELIICTIKLLFLLSLDIFLFLTCGYSVYHIHEVISRI